MVLAIPDPVLAAYIAVMLAMIFVTGMKGIMQDGNDYRQSLVAGIVFWVGVGFQNGMIFPEYVSEFADGFLRNGLAAILLTLFVELTATLQARENELGARCRPVLGARRPC